MTALLIAFAMFLGIRWLSQDRRVYDCTLCSLGVVWGGECWTHVGGEIEAPTEPLMDMTHPAIPKT